MTITRKPTTGQLSRSASENPLNFSESGWCGRILSTMKVLISILIGLFCVGCKIITEDDVVGSYEAKVKSINPLLPIQLVTIKHIFLEAYLTEIDAPPPPPPAIVHQIENKDFDERNAFHHFLRYFHVQRPGILELHNDKDVRIAYLMLHAEFFNKIYDHDPDDNPETFEEAWNLSDKFFKVYDKYIEKLGGSIPKHVT